MSTMLEQPEKVNNTDLVTAELCDQWLTWHLSRLLLNDSPEFREHRIRVWKKRKDHVLEHGPTMLKDIKDREVFYKWEP